MLARWPAATNKNCRSSSQTFKQVPSITIDLLPDKTPWRTTAGQGQEFESPPAVASLATESPVAVTGSSATLRGSFAGNEEPTEYYFQWGTTSSVENSTPLTSVGSPSGYFDVPSVNLSNLTPATTFYYRIVATNPVGTTFGNQESVTTLAFPAFTALPTSEFKTESGIGSAEINVMISPEDGGAITSCRFEYGSANTGEYTLGTLPCLGPGGDGKQAR